MYVQRNIIKKPIFLIRNYSFIDQKIVNQESLDLFRQKNPFHSTDWRGATVYFQIGIVSVKQYQGIQIARSLDYLI